MIPTSHMRRILAVLAVLSLPVGAAPTVATAHPSARAAARVSAASPDLRRSISLGRPDDEGADPQGERASISPLTNLTNNDYRDFMSRYKEFALVPGRSLGLRLGTSF